ncbi:hypothetical protein N2152v2_008022 [Parachlorella kessleri]
MGLLCQVSLVALLFGTNLGALAQLGQGASYAIATHWPTAPAWLSKEGITPILFFTLDLIFPLTMLRSMRQLEAVGAVGSVIVWLLALAVMAKALSAGLPALRDGGWEPVGFSNLGDISSAVSLFCFAFYMQVLLMPMLGEMTNEHGCPVRHRENAELLGSAASITILGTAGVTYLLTGFFGAAMYGRCCTATNLTENDWLPGAWSGGLNLLVTVYLALSIPPLLYANIYTVDKWLHQLAGGYFRQLAWWQRRLLGLVAVGLPCLGGALKLSGRSAVVLTITGATGVAMMSFLVPVYCHLCLYFGWTYVQQGLPPFDSHRQSYHKQLESELQLHPLSPSSHSILGEESYSPTLIDEQQLQQLTGHPSSVRHRVLSASRSASPAHTVALEEVVGQVSEYVEDGLQSPGLLYPVLPYRQRWPHWIVEWAVELFLPVLVSLLAVVFSLATLAASASLEGTAMGAKEVHSLP